MEESVRWLYAKGKEAFESNDADEALSLFEKLTEQVQTFADVWNMMGQLHHQKGDLGKAIECFEWALKVNPRYAEALFNLAIAYSEIGQYDKAEKLYRNAASGQPQVGDARIKDPLVKAKLANLHAELGELYHGLGIFDDSIREFEKALDLRPDFPDIRTQLAQAMFDVGRKEEAIDQLRSVKESRPDYLAGRTLLGVFLFSLDRTKEALEEWKQILEKNPHHERAKMYLRLAAKTKKW